MYTGNHRRLEDGENGVVGWVDGGCAGGRQEVNEVATSNGLSCMGG